MKQTSTAATRAPGTRRQEQAAARREQLLAAALDLFAEKGVRETSIRDIAQAAGITEGLIYHYFESKSALLRAVMERYDCLPEMTSAAGALDSLPAREALAQMGLQFLRLLSRNHKFVTMVHTEAQREPEVARTLGEFILRGLEWAREFFERRVALGELRPHDLDTSLRLLHHSLLWFGLMQEKLSPPLPQVDAEQFVRGTVDIILTGIAASPGADEAAFGSNDRNRT